MNVKIDWKNVSRINLSQKQGNEDNFQTTWATISFLRSTMLNSVN